MAILYTQSELDKMYTGVQPVKITILTSTRTTTLKIIAFQFLIDKWVYLFCDELNRTNYPHESQVIHIKLLKNFNKNSGFPCAEIKI